MMGEDKLSRAQRVRLEAFAQAVNSFGMIYGVAPSAGREAITAIRIRDALFSHAEDVERWLWEADRRAAEYPDRRPPPPPPPPPARD